MALIEKKTLMFVKKIDSVCFSTAFEHNLCKILGCEQKIWGWSDWEGESGLDCTMLKYVPPGLPSIDYRMRASITRSWIVTAPLRNH